MSEAAEKPKKKIVRKTKGIYKTISKVLLVLLIAAVCFIVGIMWKGEIGSPVITSELVGEKINVLNELTTAEYMYTNVAKYENKINFYGWDVPLTKKSFIITYDGVIKAGIDASLIEVRMEGKKIILKLPEAEIFSHEIDETSIEVFDETNNLFNPISITDYTQFSADEKTAREEAAVQKGLLTSARANAETVLTQLLKMLTNGSDNYEIVFE